MNSKTISFLLRVSPVLVGMTSLIWGTAAIAQEAPQTLAEKQAEVPAVETTKGLDVTAESEKVAQFTSVSELADPTTELSQVTSVSQLSDVQPTDWAFQALQSLVERYGCIAGYPDGTYRGNRALTRYEFAAGLNACLDQVLALVGGDEGIDPESLATIRRLQEEFAAELATLRGRVDALEARTAELEANQFSTTTKLKGEVIFALADTWGAPASGEGSAIPGIPAGDTNDDNTQTIFADRVRLTLDTSFTGKDRLRTRLQARNITSFRGGLTGTNMTRLGFDGNNGNNVELDDLYYKFPATDNVDVILAGNSVEPRDFIDVVSPIASSGSGSISRFGRLNPVLRQGDDSSGLGLNIGLGDSATLNLAYLAESEFASNPAEKNGLFNGQHAALANLVFEPSDAFKLGLSYVRYYAPGGEVNLSGSTGDAYASDPFDGVATTGNSLGAQVLFGVSDKFQVGGWYGVTFANAQGDIIDDNNDSATIMNGALQLAFPDLGGDGNLLGIVAGIPPKATRNEFSGRRVGDTSYHLEGFYRIQVSDNISVTPGAFAVFRPAYQEDNDTIVVGTIRTTFKF
ncbi:MAG TPA: iron uptake porin [Oscillatoriales cyanobacterium M59_W2019_021]|nr:iron uptake porin [Oscillatoriales cyanobacterium M4454_W2019_049]HIK51486.1 iron uptake porin [Oscillatoriales cyanobacterium M59_W2019_021]